MKKDLKELTLAEVKKVYEKNSRLRDLLIEQCYNENMEEQSRVGEKLLDYKSNSFEIEDYYSSFFLTLKDGRKFLETTDLMLTSEYGIITKEEEQRAKDLLQKYYNTTPFNTENYEDVDDATLNEIDEVAKDIMQKIEKYLHTFEDAIEDEDALDKLQVMIDDDYLENCYIDEDFILYEDVAYTKCYK